MIDYSEFLTHALGWKQLSRLNVACFFNNMIPRGGSREFCDQQQDNISSSSSDMDQNSKGEFLNAEIIHGYFTMCGKVIQLSDLEALMNEVEKIFNIPGFNGDKASEIEFELFYSFMTSFLNIEEEQVVENDLKFELEMIPSGGTSKKSESKSIESTNQSECRNQTLKSEKDNLVVE